MGLTIYNQWRQTAKRLSGNTAIVDPNGSRLRFADIQKSVEKHISRTENIEAWRDRIIALQMQNSSRWLAAFLAIQAVDGIVLPVDADLPATGLDRLARHLRIHALWNDEGIFPLTGSSRRAPACLIKLTSGSTGLPRPLFFEDAQMIADGRNIIATMGIQPDDKNLAGIPFGHSYGLGNLVMPLIMQGTASAIPGDPFPHTVAETIKRCQVTVVPTVPALLASLMRSQVPFGSIGSVRLWISAGSRLDPGLARAFDAAYNKKIHNFYGSSETGGIAYDRTGEEGLSGDSVGTPLKGVKVSGKKIDRLCVSSGAVLTRYNRHGRTGNSGRYFLPDRARIARDGRISILSRGARILKIGGKRLNLPEIENALLEMAGVEAVHTTGYRGRTGRTRVAVAIVADIPTKSLEQSLREKLPRWKIPSKWIRFEEFPINHRGKVNYGKLESLMMPGQR